MSSIDMLPADTRIPAILPIRFWTEYEPNAAEPDKPIAIEWVEWVKKGDRTGATTAEKISRLQPHNDRHGRSVVALEWNAIGKYYEQWKINEQIPEIGTPLEAWPGSSKPLIEALKKANIRTVEDFATAPKHAFSGLPFPDLLGKQKQAAAFLQAAGDRSKIAEELSSRDQKIDSLTQQIAELTALVKAGGKPTDTKAA